MKKLNRRSSTVTYALWIVQGLLALVFLFAGGMKLVLPLEQLTGPVPLPGLFVRFIGVAEVLGALGLILPGLLGIRTGLTPLAAVGLVIIMIGATVVTLVGGVIPAALISLVVGLLAAVVAYGRWRLAPHGGSSQAPVERELVFTRVFDAPSRLVFKAWTDPKQVARWWGPHGFTNPVCELDARPGGAIRIDMRGPDGVVYPMTGAYQAIVEPERLVFTSAALDGAGKPLFEVVNTVTFAEQGGKTTQTSKARVVKTTAGAARYLAGMEAGWTQSLERLAALVAKA